MLHEIFEKCLWISEYVSNCCVPLCFKAVVCGSTQWPEFDLQESTAPGSVLPIRAEVSVWEVPLIFMHHAAPLPHTVRTGWCPSPMQAQCLLSPGQILSWQNCKQWRRTDNKKQSQRMPCHYPCQREEIRRLTKESSEKANNLRLKSDAELAAFLLDK